MTTLRSIALVAGCFALGVIFTLAVSRPSPIQPPAASPKRASPAAKLRSPSSASNRAEEHPSRPPSPTKDAHDGGGRPHELDALLGAAGLHGLGHEEEVRLRSLLEAWHEEDPAAAVEWIAAHADSRTRQYLYEQLVEAVFDRGDIEAAVRLMEDHFDPSAIDVQIPYSLLEKAAAHSPELFLRAVRASLEASSDGTGSEITLPAGFDFAATFANLTELAKSLPDDRVINHLPTNLLELWVAADPQAAFEWALSAQTSDWLGKITFNYGLYDFFSGYRELATPSEYGTLVGEVWRAGRVEHRERIAFSALAGLRNSPQAFDAFVAHSGLTATELIPQLVEASTNSAGGDYDRFRHDLLSRMPPAERIAAFQRMTTDPDQYGEAERSLQRSLLQLGHAAEELIPTWQRNP